MGNESLFTRLWKAKDIAEDFRTEALKAVLICLLNKGKLVLFFQRLNIPVPRLENPTITTQQYKNSNRFDVFIQDVYSIIIFENKWDSGLNLKQLEDYDNYLQSSDVKNKYLIHVTKDYRDVPHKFQSHFYKIPWSIIYETLKQFEDDYVVREFMRFLREERIAMEKVTNEIFNGAKSIYNLTRIIERASQELGLPHKMESSSSWYTSQRIDNRIHAYFLFDSSQLCFCIESERQPSKDLNRIQLEGWGDKWWGIYFDFIKFDFFNKSPEEQVEIIKDFIRDFKNKI